VSATRVVHLNAIHPPRVPARVDGVVDLAVRGVHRCSRVFAVVIDRVTGDVAEAARALASVLGKTAYEVRPSVQVQGGGPAVVALHGEPAAAESTAAQLRAAGFTTDVVGVRDPLPDLVVARRFDLGATALGIETRESLAIALPWTDIDVLLRGTRMTQTKYTETMKETKLSLGRTLLSGGLVNTRTETTTRTRTATDGDEFLLVFAGPTVVALREHEMQYQSLGPALQPSRTANFRLVLAEIQRSSPHALRDDRLMRRATQAQILGPTLSPDEHLDFAARLVAASLRASV
jgi:hypothetical protein